MSMRRRMLRGARKRAILLATVAFLYGGFLIYGPGYIARSTDDMLKRISENGRAISGDALLDMALSSRLTVPTASASNVTTGNLTASQPPTAVDARREIDKDVRHPESETEGGFLLRMAGVQKARHDLLRQRCEDTYNITRRVDFRRDREKLLSWKPMYEHAYANDDFKFIICRVLKVGSFSWRKVMRSLHAKGSEAFRKKQTIGDFPMRRYDDQTFLDDLQNYAKVLFVREPFARLLSGYRDKYVELRHFPYYKPIGVGIIQEFRKGATKREIASGRPSFEEFVRWLVRNPDDRGGDYHWRPLFDWYHPCELDYDYIGKLETASEDASYTFKMIGIDKIESYPSTETHHKFSSAKDILKEFYSRISPDLLPQIIDRYREEFVLFNYTIPQKMSDIWT